MSKKIVWFARGGGIVRAGPYKSQVEATRGLILADSEKGVPKFPLDAFVWPEEVVVKPKKKPKKLRCAVCGTLKTKNRGYATMWCDVCLNCDWERDEARKT